MDTIYLKLEVHDKYGSVLKVYTKQIKSVFTPEKGMIFNAEDYTLTAKRIYFDINDGSVFVLFVEYADKNDWDFILKDDWEALSESSDE